MILLHVISTALKVCRTIVKAESKEPPALKDEATLPISWKNPFCRAQVWWLSSDCCWLLVGHVPAWSVQWQPLFSAPQEKGPTSSWMPKSS